MKKSTRLVYLLALLSVAVPLRAAYADPPWERDGGGFAEEAPPSHDNGYNDHKDRKEHHKRAPQKQRDNDLMGFREEDRVRIQAYLGDDYRRRCPSGLAKKHNGCRPPGLAKHYKVGRPLSAKVVYGEVPPDLLTTLRPVPAGYRYVTVDKDVLLVSEASKKVIDAVTLLSAVGK